MIYAEERWPTSPDWSPVKYATMPTIKDGRVVLNGSIGPRIRAVQEIPADHHGLTLVQLREVYGTNGRFRATQGVSDA